MKKGKQRKGLVRANFAMPGARPKPKEIAEAFGMPAPEPPRKENVMILSTTIWEIQELRTQVEKRKRDLADAAATLDKVEKAVITDLKRNVPLGPGCPPCAVEVTQQVRPKWAEEFLKRCGQSAADAVRAATPPMVTEKLVIGTGMNAKPEDAK